MPEDYDIRNDNELKAAVRTETQYDDAKLSASDLDGLVDSAKRDLALRANVTDFDYSDRGVSVALLGLVCAKAKGAVENSPVVTKDLGAQQVTFRTSDSDSLQLQQYEDMARRGIASSEKAEDGTQLSSAPMQLTRDWLNDSTGLQ